VLNRREMMQTAMAFAVWPALRPLAAAQQMPGSGAPDDEVFWADVRSQFELTPDFVNLVSVVRGHFTKANREIAFNEATRLNQLSAPRSDAEWQQEVKKKAAAFIGASAENVALLRNTTEGVTTVLLNWPLQPGDEILTSSAEHGPFYDTLARRAARDRVTVREFHYPAPVTSQQSILDAIDRNLTPRTRLVTIGQVVLLGQINPVRAIADLVHRKGAKLLVDGVLGLAHVPTDVRAMDCDFYAAGFHKFACRPRATALFFVRPHLVGFYLTSRWLTRVSNLPKFRAAVTLDPHHCAGLVAWELTGISPTTVRKVLAENHVRVGRTESYAGFFDIPQGAPRFLFIANAGPFTSKQDVDRLADTIAAVQRGSGAND
jgi:selenocysteine lyase/cysteine desulfurase